MKLHVLNPVSSRVEEKGASAPRLRNLEGKTVGLFWNAKPGGDAALKRTSELLKARFPGVETKTYVGSIGGSVHCATKEDVKRIAQECVAVVGSTAD